MAKSIGFNRNGTDAIVYCDTCQVTISNTSFSCTDYDPTRVRMCGDAGFQENVFYDIDMFESNETIAEGRRLSLASDPYRQKGFYYTKGRAPHDYYTFQDCVRDIFMTDRINEDKDDDLDAFYRYSRSIYGHTALWDVPGRVPYLSRTDAPVRACRMILKNIASSCGFAYRCDGARKPLMEMYGSGYYDASPLPRFFPSAPVHFHNGLGSSSMETSSGGSVGE